MLKSFVFFFFFNIGENLLEILLRHAVPPTLVDDVHAGEHDLDGDDDGDEHAHLGRRGGDDYCKERTKIRIGREIQRSGHEWGEGSKIGGGVQ